MRIDDISIKPRPIFGLAGKEWVLHIESQGRTFDGTFDNLISFMHAVSGAIKYFGQAQGLLVRKDNGEFASTKHHQ